VTTATRLHDPPLLLIAGMYVRFHSNISMCRHSNAGKSARYSQFRSKRIRHSSDDLCHHNTRQSLGQSDYRGGGQYSDKGTHIRSSWHFLSSCQQRFDLPGRQDPPEQGIASSQQALGSARTPPCTTFRERAASTTTLGLAHRIGSYQMNCNTNGLQIAISGASDHQTCPSSI
jgi:hypothetical protein